MRYSNFVLVGTDSDLLSSIALSGKIYGELFNRHDGEVMEDNYAKGVLIKVGEDPLDFLTQLIFAKPLGFCLLYDQARAADWAVVWSYIKKHNKIVIVKRNPLEKLLSIRGVPAYIDPDELKRIVLEDECEHKELASYFSKSEHIIVNIPEECMKISEFLGIEIKEFPTSESYAYRIENYKELEKAFNGTFFERYL